MEQPPLTKLMEALAGLFDDFDESKMIVANALMDGGKIPPGTAPDFNWMHIVHESLRQGAFDRLVEAAIAEPKGNDAAPQLRKLLNEHKEWSKHHPMSVEKLIAVTTPSTYFQLFLTRALEIFAALVLVIGIAMGIYWRMPSNTSNLAIRGLKGKDDSAFVAKIRNDGGRSAELVDGGLALEFTGLPIQTHRNIILVDAGNARRIPGHRDVHITLTTTTLFTPIAKPNGENCFPTENEIKELLPKGKVVLTARVEESGHREKTVRTEPVAASLIQPFILRAYPDDVPTSCH